MRTDRTLQSEEQVLCLAASRRAEVERCSRRMTGVAGENIMRSSMYKFTTKGGCQIYVICFVISSIVISIKKSTSKICLQCPWKRRAKIH